MTAEHECIVCKCHFAEGITNWKNEDDILYQYVFI